MNSSVLQRKKGVGRTAYVAIAPIALRALPQQVGEGIGAGTSRNGKREVLRLALPQLCWGSARRAMGASSRHSRLGIVNEHPFLPHPIMVNDFEMKCCKNTSVQSLGDLAADASFLGICPQFG
jgi:hypothetical protein